MSAEMFAEIDPEPDPPELELVDTRVSTPDPARIKITTREIAQALANIDLQQAARRFFEDLLAQAMPSHWEMRADAFDAVGTPESRLTALACRQHAVVLRMIYDEETEL